MPTNRDHIRELMERFPGRDDDEMAAALKISPRQTVSIICRELERRAAPRAEAAGADQLVRAYAAPIDRLQQAARHSAAWSSASRRRSMG